MSTKSCYTPLKYARTVYNGKVQNYIFREHVTGLSHEGAKEEVLLRLNLLISSNKKPPRTASQDYYRSED